MIKNDTATRQLITFPVSIPNAQQTSVRQRYASTTDKLAAGRRPMYTLLSIAYLVIQHENGFLILSKVAQQHMVWRDMLHDSCWTLLFSTVKTNLKIQKI